MRPKPNALLWMGFAFCAALGVAAVTIGILGTGERGLDAALSATARISFLFFWLAYAGGAISAVFGSIFQPLKQRGREFGLAFASAHLAHLGLVAWLCLIGDVPAVSTFVFFGAAVVWVYLLALLSIGHIHRRLNPKVWWLLRTGGMNFILYAFAVDFFNFPLHAGFRHQLEYAPFVVLVVAAVLLRLAEITLSITNIRRGPSYGAG